MGSLVGAAGCVMFVVGCGSSDQLFPLRVDNEWSYGVKTGIPEYVEEIKVTKRVPVAGVQGYELASSMGISRLVWKDDTLYATAMTGTRFNPPLPLLSSAEEKATFSWEGTLYSSGIAHKARATITQTTEPLMRDGRKTSTTKTVQSILLPDREIETITWYAAGTGMIMQVQRTKEKGNTEGQFDYQLDYLGGP